MTKIKTILLTTLLLTGCNYQAMDFNLKYNLVHIYETDKCYKILSWRDYDGEQLQVDVVGYGKILISSYNCMLIVDKCPICEKEK